MALTLLCMIGSICNLVLIRDLHSTTVKIEGLTTCDGKQMTLILYPGALDVNDGGCGGTNRMWSFRENLLLLKVNPPVSRADDARRLPTGILTVSRRMAGPGWRPLDSFSLVDYTPHSEHRVLKTGNGLLCVADRVYPVPQMHWIIHAPGATVRHAGEGPDVEILGELVRSVTIGLTWDAITEWDAIAVDCVLTRVDGKLHTETYVVEVDRNNWGLLLLGGMGPAIVVIWIYKMTIGRLQKLE